ncbi:MAG: DUF493 domain-containing protein [Burkholderiaceae bacterium]
MSTDVFDRLEALLEFPTDFPLKVIGRRVDGFAQAVSDLVRRHAPDFDPATMTLRPSAKGNWLSLTVVVRVRSREQLETLYRALDAHELVRTIL